MQSDVNSTTYVIGRCDGLVLHLRALINWLAKDAAERSARARVVFLGGVVYGNKTKVMMDEVYRLPGSAIIMGSREVGLLDFLEGDWNRGPTMRWMAHGGRAVVESFGVDPNIRRSTEIRRIVKIMSPPLLEVLRAGKEFQIEGDFCFTDGWGWPKPPLVDGGLATFLLGDDEITSWHKAVEKIVVHERAPTNDCYPEVDDWSVALGGFPAQTGRVHLLAIDNGKASRFVFASREHGKAPVTVAVKPAEMFRKAPFGAARFA